MMVFPLFRWKQMWILVNELHKLKFYSFFKNKAIDVVGHCLITTHNHWPSWFLQKKKKEKKKKKMQKPIKPLQKHLNPPLNRNSQIQTHCHNRNHSPKLATTPQSISTYNHTQKRKTHNNNPTKPPPQTTNNLSHSLLKTYPTKQTESSNSVKHYSLFRPQILKPWLNYFYSNLFKCGTRLNDTQ